RAGTDHGHKAIATSSALCHATPFGRCLVLKRGPAKLGVAAVGIARPFQFSLLNGGAEFLPRPHLRTPRSGRAQCLPYQPSGVQIRTTKNDALADVSRREFLKTTAVAVAGLGLTGVIAPAVHASSDETLKIALIGCGNRGTGALVQALSTQGPVKLWAMADTF